MPRQKKLRAGFEGVFLRFTPSEAELSLVKELGFSSSSVLVAGKDFVFLEEKQKKKVLSEARKAKKKGKFLVARVFDEDHLRFVVEHSPVDMVLGMEKINPKDSMHYPRSGVDQVIAKIAAKKGKTLAFSFQDILAARPGKERAQLLHRMRFTLKFCKKYGVKVFFGNFALRRMELRAQKDLMAFFRLLQKK